MTENKQNRSHLALIPLETRFSGSNALLVYKEKSHSVNAHASADPVDPVLNTPLVVLSRNAA
jgi:hypothetical protein